MLDLEELVQEEEKKAPLICLLTTGSDPCSQVEGMARAAETEYRQISMGQVGFLDFGGGLTGFVHQGQEDSARKMITEAILNGHWLMLQVSGTMDIFAKKFSSQNCHLCLDFCEEIITTVVDTEDMHRNFR